MPIEPKNKLDIDRSSIVVACVVVKCRIEVVKQRPFALPFKHKVEQMQVRLRAAVPIKGLLVEELFVQAVELAEPAKRQARA